MSDTNKPWTIASQLTLERLKLLARTIQDVRGAALELHDPASGETTWSLGCRCYERLQRRFQELAAGEWSDWFRYAPLGPRLAYLVHVDGIAVRHYWAPFADEAAPPPKHIRRAFENRGRAQQLSLPGFEKLKDDVADLTWLIQVETDALDLSVDRIVIFRADAEGEVRDEFAIPLDPSVRTAAMVRDTVPPAVEIEPPSIGHKRPENDSRRTADDGGNSE